jgi:membrane protein implicated in regulation of membrane protease activity
MTWESFYLICFLVGFLLSLVSFLVQSVDLNLQGAHGGDFSMGHGDGAGLHLDHGHGGDASVDVQGHGDSDGARAAGVVSKFNFSTITAFLAWFGGTGYLLNRYTSIWTIVAFLIASLMGLSGAAVVFWFLSKLMARDRTLNPADFDMIGVLGQVSSPVRRGGVGEMIFTQDGIRRCAPIRSEDETEIEKGAEVVVTRYEKGIGYVRRWSDLTGLVEER